MTPPLPPNTPDQPNTNSSPEPQLPFALPADVSESDLLAYIEHALPDADAPRVLAAIASAPRDTRRAIEALRADRTDIASLPQPTLSADLQHTISATIDAELGTDALAFPLPAPASRDELRRSTLIPRGPGVLRTLLYSALVRRSLAAAAVLLLAGLSYLSLTTAWNAYRSSTTPSLARAPAPDDAPSNIPSNQPATSDEPQLAANEPDTAAPDEPAATTEPTLASTEPTTITADLTPAQALDLAKQGRLVLLVSTIDDPATRDAIATLAYTSSRPPHNTTNKITWHPGTADVLPTLATALASAPPSPLFPRASSGTNTPTPIIIAGDTATDDEPARIELPAIDPATAAPITRTFEPLYTVELPAVAHNIRALCRELNTASKSANLPDQTGARYVILDAAPPSFTPTPSLAPDAVLWWDGPTSNWTTRITVPIVIEHASN